MNSIQSEVVPDDIIPRNDYIERVIPFIGKQIIKVFTGQRRVGKSYLFFQLIQHLKKENKNAHFIYINKEDIIFDFIKTAKDLSDYVLSKKIKTEKNFVFIDEIQEIVGFENALRSLLLDKSLDIYCTGSNANLLSADVAGKLSGRCMEMTVYSLSFIEFLKFHNLKNTDESLELYLKFGGLPYLRNLELKDGIVFEYLKNIYNTIVYRDVVNRHSLRNSHFLEQLILFLADNIGSIFSANKISDFLKSQRIKLAPNQVQAYIGYLENAFIIQRASRYDIVGKRLFEIGDKFYFENLGIRHSVWGYRVNDLAKIIENAVFNQLKFKNYKVTIGKLNENEIDFIAEKEGEKYYYQVALTIKETKTMEREFGNLLKIKDNYAKTIITYDKFKGNTLEGVICTDLRTFLSS
jgi:predicted AAA+ superfamily ATPase